LGVASFDTIDSPKRGFIDVARRARRNPSGEIKLSIVDRARR
jgi:hypothetical protein